MAQNNGAGFFERPAAVAYRIFPGRSKLGECLLESRREEDGIIAKTVSAFGREGYPAGAFSSYCADDTPLIRDSDH